MPNNKLTKPTILLYMTDENIHHMKPSNAFGELQKIKNTAESSKETKQIFDDVFRIFTNTSMEEIEKLYKSQNNHNIRSICSICGITLSIRDKLMHGNKCEYCSSHHLKDIAELFKQKKTKIETIEYDGYHVTKIKYETIAQADEDEIFAFTAECDKKTHTINYYRSYANDKILINEEMTDEQKYTVITAIAPDIWRHIHLTTDETANKLYTTGNIQLLDTIEYVITAAEKGLVSLIEPRTKDNEPDIYVEFTINADSSYKETGFETIILKWYNDIIDTNVLLDTLLPLIE